jgi:hypothetical protein
MEDRDAFAASCFCSSDGAGRPAPIRLPLFELTFLQALVFLTGPTTITENLCFPKRTTAGVRLEASPLLRRVSDVYHSISGRTPFLARKMLVLQRKAAPTRLGQTFPQA